MDWTSTLEREVKLREAKGPFKFVAEPETYGQVAYVLTNANKFKFTVTPLGRGSHLIGPPRGSDVALSTLRLNGVVEVSRPNSFVTVKAGSDFNEVQRTLSKDGLFLPFIHNGTVGGLASINAPGPFSTWAGFPRNALLGSRLVTGYGSLILSGGRTAKFSSGYKIWKALSGTMGWLGVYVELTFRTLPSPEEVKVGEVGGEWRSILRFRPWGLLFNVEEGKGRTLAVFAGSKNYVDSVLRDAGLRETEMPNLELDCPKVIGLHVTRGTEDQVLSSLSPSRGIGFLGTGYSRLCTEESEGFIRSKIRGFAVVERGKAKDYWGFSSTVLCLLKEALDPGRVLSPGLFDNCLTG